ncbi:MAG: biotin transporter BioY [Oscillospiraceae bacterium]|nr:biotin transporter BioY [Oscillospiraceae bacterium]
MKQKTRKLSVRLTIRNICYISLFAAAIAVCAQIIIPMPAVPFTLQTFAVPLAGIILGAKKGTLAVLVYILLGMTGVPVFAGFRGGFGVIFGATGGFILSFPVMALIAGIFSDLQNKFKLKLKNIRLRILFLACGLILGAGLNYICGLLFFCYITSRSLGEAFALCVTPFLLPDTLKIILAGGIGVSVRNILVRNKILD